jgi:hypothetical protein
VRRGEGKRGRDHWSDRHYRGETIVGLVGVVAGVLAAIIANAAR